MAENTRTITVTTDQIAFLLDTINAWRKAPFNPDYDFPTFNEYMHYAD